MTSGMARGASRAGPFVGLVGGLVAGGAAAADWVVRTETRSVGGVELEEVARTPGTELVPWLVVVALAAVVAAGAAALSRGAVRALAGSVLGLIGVAGLALAGIGAARAGEGLTAAPAVAAVGALAVAAGGVMTARRLAGRKALLGPRYSIDEDGDDEEWGRASVDEDA